MAACKHAASWRALGAQPTLVTCRFACLRAPQSIKLTFVDAWGQATSVQCAGRSQVWARSITEVEAQLCMGAH